MRNMQEAVPKISIKDLEKIWATNEKILPAAVNQCVHELFAEQARAQPSAPALCAWDGEMTYGKLDELSTRLAGHLVSLGVRAEDMVPLCFEKSMWTVVAMLAVLKAGGAFVPLDPDHPASRHEEIFKQTKARVVLTSVQHATLWPDSGLHVISVGEAFVSQLPSIENMDKVTVYPSNVAYVMFTSGSTGVPKGVVLEHHAVATGCLNHGKAIEIERNTRALQFATYTFDACIAEIITPLVRGSCVCIPSEDDRHNALSEAMNAMNVNWAQLTPTVARLLDPRKTPSLKTLVLGGERVNGVDWERWGDSVKQINAYGPTECTVWCNSYTNNAQGYEPGTIGKPIASVSWVVDPDDHNRLAPLGAIGELLVEGPILARGYLNDVVKTEAVFINNPPWLVRGSEGSSGRQGRLYKTGDLVYYGADGNLLYVGRKDSQVKVRGQRVELSEIEYHLHECMPEIKRMAVEVISPTGDKDKAMVAVFLELDEEARGMQLVCKSSESDSTVRVVCANDTDIELAQRLPSHMVPEVYFAIAQLPMTTSTKINRRRLQEIGASFSAQQLAEMRTRSQGPKRQPETQAEQTMQQLWAQVLGIDASRIGLDDSFFRLGGDSIAAMKLVAEARHIGLKLAVHDVFHAPRLGHLASQTMHHLSTGPTAITKGDHSGPIAQSFAQSRLWFLEELHPGLAWYLMPLALRINGPLQLDALKAALQAVECRHETLRTTFSTQDGAGVQVVRSLCSQKEIPVVEVCPYDEQDLINALHQDQTTPFNLQEEPGWRVRIYQLNEQEYVLSIVIHHIISDGWSLDVLKKELAVLYAAAVRGEDPISRLSPLPVQYRDFSAWQRMPEQMQDYQKQLDYWVAELQASRPAEFLCDKPRPATLSGKAGTHRLRIDGRLYNNLRRFCRVHEVTPFAVLLAAFRAAHYRLTGQDDATIGAPNANRDQWELRDMIGFFVNMQCIRIKIEEETSFGELVQRVYSTVVGSLANQNVPFESVVSALQRDRDISRNPLAQVVFAVHAQKDLNKFTLEAVETDVMDVAATSRFDLEFHFFQEQSGLQGYIYFSEDLFAPETISCLASVFESLLAQCLDEPGTKIASARLMTDKAYAQLDRMGLLQVDDKTSSRESSIVDVFREQAAAWPSKVAVKDASAEMTYAQLDVQSDRLAQALATRALNPETAIGVLAHRCCETIVAFLGILKAGLAYVPFDARAPAKRMESVLSSFPGQKLVLVGMGVQAPSLGSTDVEFVCIADMSNEASDNSLARRVLIVNNTPGPLTNSLAYIIFTSGSTGQPKGVMVEHRGIVRMAQHHRIAGFQSTKAMAHMANLAFDGSSLEIYTCLLNGGTLVCIDAATVLDEDALLRAFGRHSIRVALFTPALLKYSLAASPHTISTLDVLLVGGDRADPEDMFAAQSLVKGRVANAYGPTENSVMSTLYILTEDERCVNGVPIGRAISSSGAYVMDSEQHLVPLGVIGELVVTGDGVARGYTDPKRNIDRFVTVTVGSTTMRAYRTGDYVRQRPTDGQLEFFGRIDGQVKIRGHRVELGEIESVLSSHRCVRDAVVVLAQKDHNDQGLFGYVTLKQAARMTDDQVEDSNQLQHVNAWEERFDSETYAPINFIRPGKIGRDFIGWTSMYDGSDIDKTEMNEWLDDTIRTIYAIADGQPGHILEIGSGTGMILFNLSDGLQGYVGLDPSKKAVSFITETARCMPSLTNKVRMYKATATDASRIEPPLKADLAVLNSVVQYFPSQEYLFRVVEDLLHVEDIKMLFFGDIRSHALHREFLATRALRIAGDGASKEDIQRIVEDMEQIERELLVDPGFFTSLPSRLPNLVQHVEIQPKRMRATNELSCYRYTAIVYTKHKNALCREVQSVPSHKWVDFEKQKLDRRSLLERLENLSNGHIMAVGNIPHSKTIFSRCLLDSLNAKTPAQKEWISSIRQEVEQTPCLSAMDLVDVAEEAGCRAEISWSRQYSQHGGLDCIFYRRQPSDEASRVLFEFPSDHENRPQNTFSNRPLQQQFVKEVQQQLEEAVRLQLPAYMVPQSIHVLDKLPINENGKVDRKALAQRTQTQTTGTEDMKRQPETQAEQTMQQLWAQVLGIEASRIGLDDSFFRLGGDSITAMKLVAMAREEEVGLTVANIFQYPKLVDLAAMANQCAPVLTSDVAPFSLLDPSVDAEQVRKEVAAVCSIDPNLIEDIYPCSPLQEGMMSLTLKRAGDYTMQCVLELRVDVDEDAFRAAWEEVVQSLPILRTRILQHSTLGLLQAVVAEKADWVQDDSLEQYLHRDKLKLLGLNNQLTRYALIQDHSEGKRSFVWTIHHALYDGWTVPRILGAVEEVYNGAVLQSQPGFNAFIKYLVHQDEKAATSYWQSTLANCSATIFPFLPSNIKEPIANTSVEYQCALSTQATSDNTLSTVVRAAWAIVSSKYTNSGDVVFGTTVTGRNAAVTGIENINGPTIATVPVRVQVQGDQSVSIFLQELQQQAAEMMKYEQTGMQRIAKMGTDMRHACGFQTLLVVQPAGDVFENHNMFGEWHRRSDLQDFTTYALIVQCMLAEEGVRIAASFDARVITKWQVKKMLQQFSFVMQQLARATPSTKVADIDTTTPDDRQQLWEWNQTVPAAVNQCVHELFAEQARAQPSAPALCAWDGEMTYGKLDELSTRLAGHLVSLGVRAEDMVPLCFEKSIWIVIAMLAVLKAGGAFVPLDPDHPASRQEEIFKQTKARVVLTSVQHATLWPDSGLHVISVGEAFVSQLPSIENMDKVTVYPSNVAYIMFTSGSTGVPKGVVVEHRAVSTSCLGHGQVFDLSRNTRALQFAAYTFDACIVEIITTLLYGGCVCIPSKDNLYNDIADVINAMCVDWALLTPSVARLLDPRAISSIKTLVLGGEKVNALDYETWKNHVRLMDGFGPAECCVVCIGNPAVDGLQSGTIGKPIASVSWVVDPDDHNRLAPLGAIGELLVEGPILARGYLNDAVKTEAAFINNPPWLVRGSEGSSGRQGRLYKTGDLVYYGADGNLLYVGRKDSQVKVRGQRVELSEIEYHLHECMPEIKRMAVEVIRPSGEESQALLVAFLYLDIDTRDVLLGENTTKDKLIAQVVFPAGVEERLAERLPEYMVPTVFFNVIQMPMTASGKTDRKRLREIGASFSVQQLAEMRTFSQGPKRRPETQAEQTMQQLWAQVLGIEASRIGLDDSFFRLGGDSITAMKLVAMAREEEVGLTVANIFQYPKLVDLAAMANQCAPVLTSDVAPFSLLDPSVDAEQVRKEVAAVCSIDPNLIEDIYPCSPLQEGMMSLTLKRAGDYTMQCVLELRVDVDEDAFRAAWEEVVQSLPILRTRILQHSTLGLLQAVVAEKADWVESHSLATYLEHDQSSSIELSQPLARYALVRHTHEEKRWFVWTVHHALYDGWSMPRILSAVRTVYNGEMLGKEPAFNSFIKYLSQLDQEATATYWQTALSGCEATLFPPLIRGVQQPIADAIVEHQCPPLPKVTSEATLSTTIRAAWAILASQYTGLDDVVFGATVAGRNAPVAGIETIVGPIIATVPVRIRVQRGWTVREFLRAVQQQATEMIPYEQTGLQQIAKLGPGAQHACGFQTLLIVQPTGGELEVDDKFGTWGSASELQGFTTYALMVQCTLAEEGVRIAASFDARVITKWQVKKMLQQFSFVMQQLARATPSTKVADIDTTTPDDRQQLWEWNQTVPAAVNQCVHELFAEQARAQPSAPALCAWDGEMTYGKLDELSTRLAGHLVSLGVRAEDMVPLCFEKSMWTVVAMLAVLKAGGAFVPLDPDHPASRQEEIFKQTKARVVLTSVQHATLWPDSGLHVISVGEAFVSQLPSVENMDKVTVYPSNVAYIMFTSGSTGVPKGVVVEHRAISNSCLGHGQVFDLSRNTRALQFAAYTFDVCLAEIITPLVRGSCVCIPSEDDRHNALSEAMNAMNVNWAQLTPTVARLLDPRKTPSLKTLVLGGERVNGVDWERWGDSVKQINAYGPTECTVWCNSYTNNAQGYEPGTIGKPIASVSWVVDPDDHNRLAPLGAIGELLVEGPILARGYLNDVVKTEAVFINNPPWLVRGSEGSSGRQGRLYKTGDLVYYGADGNLLYVGRKDSQVKVRGQRVELSEIEYHLHECMPEIKRMAVEVISPTGDKDKAMVAVFLELDEEARGMQLVCKSSESDSTVRVVCANDTDIELAQRLPSHMVPEVYFAIAQLPMTTSTKINRRRLQEIGASFSAQQLAEMRTRSQGPKRQPETQAEQTMQQLWAQVLGIDASRIGLDDSFFRLGGDSIAAMKLVAEARHIGLKLAVHDVFHAPRLGHLASQTMHHLSTGPTAITKGDHSGPIAQSFAQSRLWFLEELHPGLAWYLMPLALRINGPLQLDALKAALQAVECRHETLRTTFSTQDGAGVQVVRSLCSQKEIPVVEVCPYDEQDLINALHQDQTTPFNLQEEPGWRVRIYQLNEQEYVLSIVIHHIISDGWSLDVLKKELAVLYAAAVRGEDPISRLSPLPVQYRDFSAWQRMPEQMQDYQKQLDYWVAELQASRPAEFLCDKPRPATLSGKAGTHRLRIDGRLYNNLRRFCRVHEVTPFAVLLAAFRAAHYRLTGQDDATIGAPNANRDQWELRDMIGFFVNMQCIRIKIEEETSFGELVQRVYSTVVGSLANQNVPFESVVSALQRDRDISRNPLAQVVFAVHAQKDLNKFTLEAVETDVMDVAATSRFDLEFHFFQEQSGLQGYIYFSEDLFAPETISCLASVFESLLAQCLDEPGTKIASARLMTDKAYAQLDRMGLLQVDDKTSSRESSIVDVFREQAAAWPSKVAVKDASAEMTYAQLDVQSDRLAQALAMIQLAPETAIGVFATRCCETIVAFLGILKAGLAYMPFDTQAPAKRIKTILSSFPGQKLVLVGMDIQAPSLGSTDVEFVRIADMLSKATDNSLPRRALEGSSIPGPCATSLAYIIFTSGSTGQPKGVMVEHRGIVRMAQHDRIADFRSTKATAHMANLAFDGSSWEIYTCLLNGGTLVCIDASTMLDQDALLEAFTQHSIRVAFFTPALLKHSLAASPRTIGVLDVLLVAGDRADPEDMFAAQSLVKGTVANAYGPTENSVMSTLYVLIEEERCVNGVPIGRAISSSGAYVMDAEQQLVPLGVIGELVVTGYGVARGYTDPKRNVDRFVTVTVGSTTMRAYRTGDYVRQRPTDGQLEFFGRVDGQVKIRGHRVELGEIESVLRSHRCVRDAAVVFAQKDHSNQGLVGYVTLKSEAGTTDDQAEDSRQQQHVNAWEERFDSETYAPINGIQPKTLGRDFIGWTSMYDGSDIDKDEMNEWLDDTIRAIYAVTNGQLGHILEIGSGTGMVLFNLSDSLQGYVGLDPSEKAVSFITETARHIPSLTNKVHMYKATATDTSRIERPLKADLAILNSVVQYFPSQEYLFRVVEDLLRIEGIKMLFFGDIRSHALHREFLATRALRIAGDRASKEDILRMVEDMEQVERELLIDPGFFTSLPSRLPGLVEHVEIQPKKMRATNELSCYRYTVVIHTQYGKALCKEVRRVPESEWIDFEKQKLDRSSLVQQLESLSSMHTIAISNIPHSKTILSRCLMSSLDAQTPVQKEWISSVRQQAEQIPCLSAMDLIDMAEEAGCCVKISWSRQCSQHGGLDCIFYRRQPSDEASRVLFEFPSDHENRPQNTFSNRPLQQQFVKEVQQQLEEAVRLQLPAYMVPQSIHVLDKLPINENGKVDRKALAQRTQTQTTGTEDMKRQPETQAEQTMQQLWAQVLGIEASRIGLDDSFFRLGGDSITAMKLVAEARKVSICLSVADILRNPQLSSLVRLRHLAQQQVLESPKPFSLLLAAQKEFLLSEIISIDTNMQSSDITDILPATHMQDVFISRGIRHPSQAFNYFSMDMGYSVDTLRLRESCSTLVQHFPILRTRFIFLNGQLWQVVLRTPELQFSEFVFSNSVEEGSNAVCLEDSERSSPLVLPTSFILVKSALGKYRLILRLSHAQYDGVCLPLILETLFSIYYRKHLGPLCEFSTYLAYVQSRRSVSELHWRKLLQGSQMTNVTSVLCPSVQESVTPRNIKIERVLSMPPLPEDLTVASVVSSAWATILSYITGKEDVVYGYLVAGRNSNIPSITEIVGPCVNIIPVRARVLPSTTLISLAKSIQEQYLSLGESDSMGFNEIVQNCTDWPAATTFDSLLQHQNIDECPAFDFEGATRKLELFENPSTVSEILSVVSYPQNDRLKFVVCGNTHIITMENAEMIGQMLCETIAKL